MVQAFASIAVGTAVTLLAAVLLLLRMPLHGRRPVVALTHRWINVDTRTSGIVLGSLVAIAAACFVHIAEAPSGVDGSSVISRSDVHVMPPEASDGKIEPDTAQAFADLRAYAANTNSGASPKAVASPDNTSTALPDVDTMIAKLIARLEKQPNDVNGWKMLGWSYVNTGRPGDAATAYETALKLQPGDTTLKKALDEARTAQAAPQTFSPSVASPSDNDVAAAAKLSNTENKDMIRGMVDKLTARLEASPNDENGWLRLMSSRVTLGETEAAKTALTKALQAFSGDAAAKVRLVSAARELGIKAD
ncbi:tetratricopeptide repeat protein [Hyphomicrobium sp. MC8b]|uniref:tetratricopeptide repeat protein n=1 Tax=Hyphomicrobium sp. MC8b TaxID=300273 RepID=UPI00391ADDF5